MAIGRQEKNKGKGYIKSVINNFIQELFKILLKRDKDFNYLEMEISTKDVIKTVNLMEKVNTFGLMDQLMWAILLMDRDQGMENGYQVSVMEIYISDNIKKIKNREKGNIYGLQAVFFREISYVT